MKDWRERAFLRAQLIEEGIRTLAVETLNEGLDWISDDKIVPAVIIYDDQSQEDPTADIRLLSEHASSIPILIIAAGGKRKAIEFKRPGFGYIITRPVRIGSVVEKVKEILESDLI
jgi:DNA-binding NtrC family response regulator